MTSGKTLFPPLPLGEVLKWCFIWTTKKYPQWAEEKERKGKQQTTKNTSGVHADAPCTDYFLCFDQPQSGFNRERGEREERGRRFDASSDWSLRVFSMQCRRVYSYACPRAETTASAVWSTLSLPRILSPLLQFNVKLVVALETAVVKSEAETFAL